MAKGLHRSARTTPRVRAEFQASQASTLAQLNETPDKQISLTDSDACSMKKRSCELDASLRTRLPLKAFNR